MEKVQQLGKKLIQVGQTLTSAESLTGGLFSSSLTQVPGISKVLPGAFVTYSPEAKTQLVGVPAPLIQEYGVVSAEVAKAMAKGAQQQLSTDWAISFTGVAGPDALEGHLAGEVWIGVAAPKNQVLARQFNFKGTRDTVRMAAVQAGAAWVLSELNKVVTNENN
ncbi:competence-damage protein [Weissella kandleri]|uniref:Competence-damage protein n=1 Tax=Weissella kandleri TaxID=1616 RepID=A0A0R2JCU0_9LACO|nr:nicotinamide-nucleotide amidohydrolase family protein [Weissella kandleri]KRN75145.1 competence-damage protein [Weissella kandleri]